MNRPCTIQGLRRCSEHCVNSLLFQLREKGFAVVSLRGDEDMQQALAIMMTIKSDVGQNTGRFRFPPVDDSKKVLYIDPQRAAFRALFNVALTGLGAILSAHKPPTPRSLTRLEDALGQWQGGNLNVERDLFSPDEHKTFRSGMPFEQSFFNLFDYDFGMLNAHVDRGLVTVACMNKPTDDGVERSKLWIADRRGKWRDADLAVSTSPILPQKHECEKDGHHSNESIVLMVGEEMENSGLASSLDLFAATHCVRVDPMEEDIARAHFRPDPASAPTGNRRSAAFVLRHDHSF